MKNILIILVCACLCFCKKKNYAPPVVETPPVCTSINPGIAGIYNPYERTSVPVSVKIEFLKSNCPTDNLNIYVVRDLKDYLNDYLLDKKKPFLNQVDTFYVNESIGNGYCTGSRHITFKISASVHEVDIRVTSAELYYNPLLLTLKR